MDNIRLGEVVTINPDSITRNYPFQIIEYIDISSVGSGTLEGTKSIPIEKAPSRARRLINEGDTIISTVRPNRRSFLFIKNPLPNTVVSTGFAVLRATVTINERYLYYTVSHQAFTDYLTSRAKGAAYPAVDTDIIADAEILLPPLPTQQKIAGILSAYDDLIENNTRRVQILEEMAQRIYREWFVHFRYPDYENDELVESELGMNPEGWEVTNLGDLFNIKYGKGLPLISIREAGKYPVYGAGDVIGYYNELVVNEKVALITCRGNGSGTVWRTKGPSFVTNNSFFLLPKESYSHLEYHFAEQFLINSNVKTALSGSAQPQITITGLSTVKTLMPAKFFIERYCENTRDIPELIDKLYEKNRVLRQSHDLLLPKLISGKIDVSGLDIDVGETDDSL